MPEDYSAHCGRERTRKAVRLCCHPLTIRDLAHCRRPTFESTNGATHVGDKYQSADVFCVAWVPAPGAERKLAHRPPVHRSELGAPIAADVDRVKLAPMLQRRAAWDATKGSHQAKADQPGDPISSALQPLRARLSGRFRVLSLNPVP